MLERIEVRSAPALKLSYPLLSWVAHRAFLWNINRSEWKEKSGRVVLVELREILRLTYECGRSQREIAVSLSIAVGTICGHLKRARKVGLTWERAQVMTDSDVESLLYRYGPPIHVSQRAPIDYAHVHQELHRNTATLEPKGSVISGERGVFQPM